MEYIGKRISIKPLEEGNSIVIVSAPDKAKKILLFIWIFLWSISGVIVISQYFLLTDQNTRAAIIVWIGFWAYFEYRILKAFMWRSYGVEKVKIEKGKLYYKRDVSGKGKVRIFENDFIKDLRVIPAKENSFFENMNNSYWMISGEKIAFDYNGKEVRLGLQLEEKDAQELFKRMRKMIS